MGRIIAATTTLLLGLGVVGTVAASPLAPGFVDYPKGGYQGFEAYEHEGRVSLTGLVQWTGGGSMAGQVVAVLPEHQRPWKRLVFNQPMHEGFARVDVLHDGKVLVMSVHGKLDWVSLDGIEFLPQKPTYTVHASCANPGATTDASTCETAKCGVDMGGNVKTYNCDGTCGGKSVKTCDNAFKAWISPY